MDTICGICVIFFNENINKTQNDKFQELFQMKLGALCQFFYSA